MSLNNLLFLSHGVQLCMFLLLVGLILVFMKMTTFEVKLKNMEEHMSKFITAEEYMESFNNMYDEKAAGRSTSPFDDDDEYENLE